jgi:hypothetical protein
MVNTFVVELDVGLLPEVLHMHCGILLGDMEDDHVSFILFVHE